MSVATKELPVLFKGPMVRAILEGRKVQTRRIMKPQPEFTKGRKLPWSWKTRSWAKDFNPSDRCQHCSFWGEHCPYGKAGDRLWVRETWCRSRNNTFYRADHGDGKFKPNELSEEWDWAKGDGEKWKPSIFMPRDLCRIELEITGVRVERLQSISEVDARAEGVAKMKRDPASSHQWLFTPVFGCDHPSGTLANARECFESGWIKINGKDSWAANPWCWVIEFKRVPCTAK